MIGFDFFYNRFIIFCKQEKLFNRELRPPFIPPKKKMISEDEIKKMESAGKLVMEEIKVVF